MRAVICGMGTVGYHIARELADSGNDVTIIDQNGELVRSISNLFDVRGVAGHASHPDILQQANAADCDLVIAVTDSDEINMITCQMCHSLFSVPLKIARIRAQTYLDPVFGDLFRQEHMPIDEIISPEIEIADAVCRRLQSPGAFESYVFLDGAVTMVGISLEEDCPVVNTPLRQLGELFPDLAAHVVGIIRNNQLIIAEGDDQLFVGDDVYVAVASEQLARVFSAFGHEEKPANRAIIIGGGEIGVVVAQRLEEEFPDIRLKLIEQERKRAEEIATQFNRTIVLNGSALDRQLLQEAGAKAATAVISLTNHDETNIFSALLARDVGLIMLSP